MDLLIEIAVGLLGAFVGLLWPNEDPEVRRLQRSIRRMILIGLVCLVVGSCLAYAMESIALFLFSLAITIISLIVAGETGRRIEDHWRSKKKQSPDE